MSHIAEPISFAKEWSRAEASAYDQVIGCGYGAFLMLKTG